MKILIYGAGIIGCTYGWQLAKAGFDISILVKRNKKQTIEEKGVNICCSDFRNGKKEIENIIFRPKVIDTLLFDNDFEYIIVTTNNLDIDKVLTDLKKSAGKAHILFFQNLWYDDLDKINRYLPAGHYFFGFPFMAGGGQNNDKINTIISGSKYSRTMLGEITGEITPRIQKIADALDKAGMKPFISTGIISWLIPHYAFIAGISGGIINAGGEMNKFIDNPKIVRKTILSIREGFGVCSKLGIDPKKEKVNRLYYLPLLISSPVVKMVFNNESMQAMFDGYMKNSTAEINKMLDDIIKCGKIHSVDMPHLNSLREYMNK